MPEAADKKAGGPKNCLDKHERSYYFNLMNKGHETKQAILKTGLDMASQVGLEGVSIGALAKATQMSKSGLFAHFQSKEKLQLEILKLAAELFSEHVVAPALKAEAGIPRIRALVDNWIEWSLRLTGGCIFVAASTEFSDRPGRVRDLLLRQQEEWIESLSRIARSAVQAGVFRKDIDDKQFAFDLYSLLLGFHYYDHLLQKDQTRARQENALERLLSNYR